MKKLLLSSVIMAVLCGSVNVASGQCEALILANNPAVLEGNAGTADLVFTVTVAGCAAKTVTVDYATRDFSAVAGVDYLATSGRLTFAPGQTSKTITVKVYGNTNAQPNRKFIIQFNNAVGAYLQVPNGQVLGTIIDDDSRVFVNIYPVVIPEGSATNAPKARFMVTLFPTNAIPYPVSVDYFTSDRVSIGMPPLVESAVPNQDYVATNGTLTFTSGQLTNYIVVDLLPGNAVSQPDRAFLLFLTNAVNADIYIGDFNEQAPLTNLTYAIIVDDDNECSDIPLERPMVSYVSNPSVIEGPEGALTTMKFVVELACAKHPTVAIHYKTLSPPSSLAIPGVDYIPIEGDCVFRHGEFRKEIPVLVLGDALYEADEVFSLRLTSTNAMIPSQFTNLVGTIVNDDPMPYVYIGNYTNYEGDFGTNKALFTVILSQPSGQPVRVSYVSANGTAVAGTTPGSDYIRASGSVNFPAVTNVPGLANTNTVIEVKVLGDVMKEANETFFVRLSNPVNAGLGNTEGLGVIVNDDADRFISIGNAGVVEGNTGVANPTNTTLDLVLSAPCTQPVTVDFETVDVSTRANEDYLYKRGTLIFPPGITNQCITVAVLGDVAIEPNETLRVVLSNPTNALLAANYIGTVTITNDDGIAGAVDHFEWGVVNSSQTAGTAFAVKLTAKDALGNTVTNFNDAVTLAVLTNQSAGGGTVLNSPDPLTMRVGYLTLGYSFTPKANLIVTHVRFCAGTKVSIWDNTGALLGSQAISPTPGVWDEVALASPITLAAGKTYRIGFFTGGDRYYFIPSFPATPANLTINQVYVGSGDGFPQTIWDNVPLVDFRYGVMQHGSAVLPVAFQVGSNAPVSGMYRIPTNQFVAGVWTSTLTFPSRTGFLALRAYDSVGHEGWLQNPVLVCPSTNACSPMILGVELVPDSVGGLAQAGGLRRSFRVLNTLSQPHVLEVSTDLRRWTPVCTNVTGLPNTNNLGSPTNACRFYRGRSLP